MEPASFRQITEQLTTALITGDFALYQSVIMLPFRTEPREGQPYTLETVAELEQDFDLYCKAMTLNRVTDIYREILDVRAPASDRSMVRVITHILSNSDRVVHPFETEFEMRKTSEGWRVSVVRSAIGHINWSRGRAHIANGQFLES
ncbi:MAG: hypothetical protein AAGA05_10410 [Pseudomonadota bacterium]